MELKNAKVGILVNDPNLRRMLSDRRVYWIRRRIPTLAGGALGGISGGGSVGRPTPCR
jgi:hypothetical protein